MSDAEIKSIARELHRLIKSDIEKHMSEIKSIITKDDAGYHYNPEIIKSETSK